MNNLSFWNGCINVFDLLEVKGYFVNDLVIFVGMVGKIVKDFGV